MHDRLEWQPAAASTLNLRVSLDVPDTRNSKVNCGQGAKFGVLRLIVGFAFFEARQLSIRVRWPVTPEVIVAEKL